MLELQQFAAEASNCGFGFEGHFWEGAEVVMVVRCALNSRLRVNREGLKRRCGFETRQ